MSIFLNRALTSYALHSPICECSVTGQYCKYNIDDYCSINTISHVNNKCSLLSMIYLLESEEARCSMPSHMQNTMQLI